ncbi:MAG TPA: class I SAM-dependent methyltransferase [Steroidobacteraceae bacterium]|nr:class I SAM-dependent methyltransferase [Steroidobacteraceae bacterium]
MKITCTLCGSATTAVLETIAGRKIESAYAERLKIVVQAPPESIEYRLCGTCDLRFYWPQYVGDASFYEHLQKLPGYYMDEKGEYAIANRHIPRRGDASPLRILEIGAGRGQFRRYVPGDAYVGLEFNPGGIAAAARDGIDLRCEYIEQHAQSNAESYDVVCSFQVLEHVPNPQTFIESALKCLKPDGTLVLSVPAEDSFLAGSIWDLLNMPPHHQTRWSDAALTQLSVQFHMEPIALVHDRLAPGDVPSYANVVAQIGLAKRRGMKLMHLDARVNGFWFRRRVKQVTRVVGAAVQEGFLRPRGHTVVSVFRKKSP